MSKLTIKTATEDDFFQRGRQLARAADRGAALPSESTISFEDPADAQPVQPDPDTGPSEGSNEPVLRYYASRAT